MQKKEPDQQKGSQAKTQACVVEVENSRPAFNQRGIIAESYPDLQGLGVLTSARQAYPLPKASAESAIRAVFQAAEIALLNLTDLMERAASDVDRGAIGSASVKLFWARGFHRLLARISLVPHQMGRLESGRAPQGTLRIEDSPAFGAYLRALNHFDRRVMFQVKTDSFSLGDTISEESLDSAKFNMIHLTRICNHESTTWERNLSQVQVPTEVPSYEEFVVAQGMRDAVYDRELSGDSYFTQFRGLHQVPETLAEEINDHLEQAIREVRSGRLLDAAGHMRLVNVLFEGVIASLPPIVDNLATSDYHKIRENLGLTSGSHSVSLRYHLFTHLYEQLAESVVSNLIGRPIAESELTEVENTLLQAARDTSLDSQSWILGLIIDYCAQLKTYIDHWRDQHLHLPRNNLGGELTKSLTGSPDAVRAVKQMRDAARAKDPMGLLIQARQQGNTAVQNSTGQLTEYLESESSLDHQILAATGHITQSRFGDVQERLGYFSTRSSFSPPPRRTA